MQHVAQRLAVLHHRRDEPWTNVERAASGQAMCSRLVIISSSAGPAELRFKFRPHPTHLRVARQLAGMNQYRVPSSPVFVDFELAVTPPPSRPRRKCGQRQLASVPQIRQTVFRA
jgi:hypothetical protein